MAVSEDVLRLVRTVERLPREDQEKILRIVDLLSLVPLRVQDKTQQMLRELLARENLQAAPSNKSVLQVALTDPPDAFLQIADAALHLELGEIQLRQL